VFNETSPDVGLLFGVPQGSVLGPKNYCMYTRPVCEVIKRLDIKHHWYADDTQVYMTLKPCDKWDDISSSMEARIEDIGICMNNKLLKLNKDKTEFIVFSSKQRVKKTENLHIKVRSSYINCSASLRNLWHILDNTPGMEK